MKLGTTNTRTASNNGTKKRIMHNYIAICAKNFLEAARIVINRIIIEAAARAACLNKRKLKASRVVLTVIGFVIFFMNGENLSAQADNRLTFDRKWGEQQGRWSIFWNEARRGCFAVTEYENGTIFWFGLSANGTEGFVAFGHKSWDRVKKDARYDTEYVFNNSRWNGLSFGASLGDIRILLAPSVRLDFIEDIARSTSLVFAVGGGLQSPVSSSVARRKH